MPVKKGYRFSEEHNRKISLAKKGIPKSEEYRQKIRLGALRQKTNLFTTGKYAGENNHSWKGDNVKYQGLHKWLRKHFSKPDKCEFCTLKSPKDIACITGVYNREFKNWKYLCKSCHIKYDKRKKL